MKSIVPLNCTMKSDSLSNVIYSYAVIISLLSIFAVFLSVTLSLSKVMTLCGMVDGKMDFALTELPVPQTVKIISDSQFVVSDWRYVSTAISSPMATEILLSAKRLNIPAKNPEFNAPQSIFTFSSLVNGRDELFQLERDANTFVTLTFPMTQQGIEYVSSKFVNYR